MNADAWSANPVIVYRASLVRPEGEQHLFTYVPAGLDPRRLITRTADEGREAGRDEGEAGGDGDGR